MDLIYLQFKQRGGRRFCLEPRARDACETFDEADAIIRADDLHRGARIAFEIMVGCGAPVNAKTDVFGVGRERVGERRMRKAIRAIGYYERRRAVAQGLECGRVQFSRDATHRVSLILRDFKRFGGLRRLVSIRARGLARLRPCPPFE